MVRYTYYKNSEKPSKFKIKAYKFQSQEIFEKEITNKKEVERLINIFQKTLNDNRDNKDNNGNLIIELYFSLGRDLFGVNITSKDPFKDYSIADANKKPYYVKFNILTQTKNSFIENFMVENKLFFTTSINNLGLCYVRATIRQTFDTVGIKKFGVIL